VYPARLLQKLRTLAFLLALLAGQVAQATPPSCKELYLAKKYLKAAQCFQAQANQMPPSNKLDKFQRYLKGIHLRNAAHAFTQAAQKTSDRVEAAYLREQALLLLRQYLQEKLCRKNYRCRLVQGEQLALLKQINYTQVVIVTSGKKNATLFIKGPHYHYQGPLLGSWSSKLRPGSYTVTVTFPSIAPRQRQIVAGNSPNLVLQFQPPATRPVATTRPLSTSRRVPPPPPPSLLPWILVGAGATLAVAGGILAGLGHVSLSQRDQDLQRRDQLLQAQPHLTTPPPSPDKRKELISSPEARQLFALNKVVYENHQQAALFLPLGWGLVGAGAALATGGLLLRAFSPAPTPKKP